MYNKKASQQYQNIQVKTASQGKLVLMLYQGGIKFLRQAVKSIENNDWEEANRYLLRAQDVIKELMSSLNMEAGGEIAENLYNLYEYMNHNLIQANIHKDTEKIKFIRKMMLELLEAWQQIVYKLDNESSSNNRNSA